MNDASLTPIHAWRRLSHCRACGYDLRGTDSDTCSECGARALVKERTWRLQCCPTCGYDMRGTESDACSECGARCVIGREHLDAWSQKRNSEAQFAMLHVLFGSLALSYFSHAIYLWTDQTCVFHLQLLYGVFGIAPVGAACIGLFVWPLYGFFILGSLRRERTCLILLSIHIAAIVISQFYGPGSTAASLPAQFDALLNLKPPNPHIVQHIAAPGMCICSLLVVIPIVYLGLYVPWRDRCLPLRKQ